ncbi:PTS sugar transporter subunit IIA [Virgibacillus senegalensis]|uniref:PTS sugar transporter subunit IIA n=1 Tax=Virgibacillus senegalensis TaxID=1499679 RepID=UPI00069F7E70|nr:PTS sugar transporter subunit IIA [Virgibacillus senegalensis]
MNDFYFEEDNVLLDLGAESYKDVLTRMGEKLQELGLVRKSFVEAVIAREEAFSTGLPTSSLSVAIPHTDIEHVKQKSICIGVLKDEVEFGVMGDPEETTPVKVVFMLAMDEAHSQLYLLQRLMQIFQHNSMLKKIAQEQDKTKIVQLIKKELDVIHEGGEVTWQKNKY